MSGWLTNGTRLIEILDTEKDIDKYLETIKHNLLDNQETISELRKELRYARDEAFANTEMEKLREENAHIRQDASRGFSISKDEYEAIREWQINHETEQHNNPQGRHGAIGGGYVYEFYPTSIGTSGVCICTTCRARALGLSIVDNKIDKTGYDNYLKMKNGIFEFQQLG